MIFRIIATMALLLSITVNYAFPDETNISLNKQKESVDDEEIIEEYYSKVKNYENGIVAEVYHGTARYWINFNICDIAPEKNVTRAAKTIRSICEDIGVQCKTEKEIVEYLKNNVKKIKSGNSISLQPSKKENSLLFVYYKNALPFEIFEGGSIRESEEGEYAVIKYSNIPTKYFEMEKSEFEKILPVYFNLNIKNDICKRIVNKYNK